MVGGGRACEMRSIWRVGMCSVKVRYSPSLTPQCWPMHVASTSFSQTIRRSHTSRDSQTSLRSSQRCNAVATSAARHSREDKNHSA
eukprot:6190220-Pleurochrysis_carterae.AAC.1